MEDSFDESEKKGNDFSEYLLDRVRQLEERNLAEIEVTGSSPVSRSK